MYTVKRISEDVIEVDDCTMSFFKDYHQYTYINTRTWMCGNTWTEQREPDFDSWWSYEMKPREIEEAKKYYLPKEKSNVCLRNH